MAKVEIKMGEIGGGGNTYFVNNLTLSPNSSATICLLTSSSKGVIRFGDGNMATGYYAIWDISGTTITRRSGTAASNPFTIDGTSLKVTSSSSTLYFVGAISDNGNFIEVGV